MRFSISTGDITPIKPVFLCGFGDRTHKSEGVHDPLYTRLEKGELLLGRDSSEFAISRRKLTETGVRQAPNPDARMDQKLFVLQPVDKANNLKETRLIAMEGEISTEYSVLLKRMFPGGKTIVIGYSNGNYYVPTSKMIA